MAQVWLWLQWLFFLPGDTLIAAIAPTPLGALLDLTPKSLGSNTAAALSTALWLIGILLVYCVWTFLMDAADPTYRAERRERRQVQAAARRALKQRQRAIYHRRFYRRASAWVIPGAVVVLLAVLGLALLKDML